MFQEPRCHDLRLTITDCLNEYHIKECCYNINIDDINMQITSRSQEMGMKVFHIKVKVQDQIDIGRPT